MKKIVWFSVFIICLMVVNIQIKSFSAVDVDMCSMDCDKYYNNKIAVKSNMEVNSVNEMIEGETIDFETENNVLQADTDITVGEIQSLDKIEQYGITWYFDKEYQCGRYANGDYWVKTDNSGTVVVTSITPEIILEDIDEEEVKIRNGWEVNPHYEGGQGFDNRIFNADVDLLPPLPYNAEGGQSLVKTISGENPNDNGRGALQTAVVLTIVNEIPADNGATVFRPPYVGDEDSKKIYSINDIKWDRLPSYPSPESSVPDLAWVEGRYQRVQLDHKPGMMAIALHAIDNFDDDYGAAIGRDNAVACLRLMLEDSQEEKKQAMINYLQYGIDLYHMLLDGAAWPNSGGGHQPGRPLPLSFVAVMFDQAEMKERVQESSDIYHEHRNIYYSPQADEGKGKVLFGTWDLGVNIWTYWNTLAFHNSNRSIADPHGYIDGGYQMPASYQLCCTAKPWKGSVISVILMPEMRTIFNNELLFDYVDRWVTQGTWTQPDPCAPVEGVIEGGPKDGQPCTMASDPGEGGVCVLSMDNYGKTFGEDPDNPGMCILDEDPSDGIGRFPYHHNIYADEGGWGNKFIDVMWEEYRHGVPVIIEQPESKIAAVGNSITLSVNVEAKPEPSFQWKFNGSDIEGETGDTLILNNILQSNQGKYSVVVSNYQGSVTSDEAELTVLSPVQAVQDFQYSAEFYTVYLSWKNPAGQGDNWEQVRVLRKKDNEVSGFDDGEVIYEGTDTFLVDRDLSEGEYHYAVYTYRRIGTDIIYSDKVKNEDAVLVPYSFGKDIIKIAPDLEEEKAQIKIGQNTKGDLYSLWNEESNIIGKGPAANETSLWLYSDIIGNGKIATGSQIVSARLVFHVEGFYVDEANGEFEESSFTSGYTSPYSINIYQITDPDKLGIPFFADESGIRVGLDYSYRDHRPGMNIPWLISEEEDISTNIVDLLKETEPVDTIEFSAGVFEDGEIKTLEFDVTEAVQAWSEGEENQGLYITTGQSWNNGDRLVLSGASTKDEEKRPYIEVIYSSQEADVDITPPTEVQNLKVITGTDNIKLEWERPTDTASVDFAGVKIIRREGIVPFNSQDDTHVIFIEKDSNTAPRYSYTDSGLKTGKDYYYALYAYDDKHNYSDRLWVKAVPGSPEAPVLGASTPDKGELILSWEKIGGASAYRLYRDDSDQVIVKNIENIEHGSVISYTDYLLKGSYRYYVTAVNDTGESPFSNNVTVEIADDDIADNPPEEPSALQVNVNKLRAELSWTDNSSNECGFLIERKIDNAEDNNNSNNYGNDSEESEWEVIARTGFNVETYLDRDLEPDIHYYYRIKAFNSKGSSEYITADSVRTSDILKAVKDISWRVISSSHIRVEWEEVNKGVSYRVELYEIEGEENPVDTQYISTDYCYFTALEVGKEYIVRVFSMRDNDEEMAESDIIRTSADAKGGLF